MIYDAIMTGTPFILTKETGMTDRVKAAAVFTDPLDKKDITEKIVWLSDPANTRHPGGESPGHSLHTFMGGDSKEIVDIWKKAKNK